MKPLYLRINRSRTNAPRHKQNLLLCKRFLVLTDKLRSTAKRTNKIMERVTRLQRRHSCRLGAHCLKYNRDRSFLSIIITNGQRNTLPILIHSHNYKLPRLTILRHTRRFHCHQIDIGSKLSCLQNFVHQKFTIPFVLLLFSHTALYCKGNPYNLRPYSPNGVK